MMSSIPQLGLLYISTYAKNFNIESTLLHTDTPYSDLKPILNLNDNYLVGFYCNSDNIHSVLKCCMKIKRDFKNIKVILGGPIATLDYNKLMDNIFVDYVCRGDGEELVTELIEHLNSTTNIDPFSINGLSFRSSDGKIIHNNGRNFPKNLDVYPIPERQSYPTVSKIEKMTLSTSRGCGFRCTFCFESIQRSIRYHSIERVIEEMRILLGTNGTKYISFSDDVFTTNKPRLIEICNAIKTNFIPHEDVFWYCEARVDSLVKDPELAKTMRESGLARIQIGTESGSQKVIDSYKKKITINQICEAVKNLNDANVQSIFTNFILGGPFDSEEIFLETVELMKKLHSLAPGRFESSCNFLSPYPGTDIYENPNNYGLTLTDTTFFTDLSGCYVCTETEEFSKEELLQKYNEFSKEQSNQMLNHVKTISFDLIRTHLVNSLQGLRTQWASMLVLDEIHVNWLSLIKTGKYKYSTITNFNDAEDLYPQRTFSLTRIIEGTLSWPMMGREVCFNGYERFLIEHFSGKLSFHEIALMSIKSNNLKEVPYEKIIKDIISYAQDLSELNLVVFRDRE